MVISIFIIISSSYSKVVYTPSIKRFVTVLVTALDSQYNYYWCSESEHQVLRVRRLVTRALRLVTEPINCSHSEHQAQRLVTALDAVLDSSGVYTA